MHTLTNYSVIVVVVMVAVVMLVGYEQKGRAARCTVLNNKMIFFDIFVLRYDVGIRLFAFLF